MRPSGEGRFFVSGYTCSAPRNQLIYVGVLAAASALLYIGGQMIRTIEWFLLWAAGAGVALIPIGLLGEMRGSSKLKLVVDDAAATETQPSP